MKTITLVILSVLALGGCVAVPYDGYGYYGPSVVVQPSFGYHGHYRHYRHR